MRMNFPIRMFAGYITWCLRVLFASDFYRVVIFSTALLRASLRMVLRTAFALLRMTSVVVVCEFSCL